MVIKRVKKTNLFDIFLGEGWENHSRVAVVGEHLKHVSGKVLPRFVAIKVMKTITNKGNK